MQKSKTATDYTTAELMAVAMARQFKVHDGDWIAVGAFSQLPMAAVKLARMLYAPNIWWLAGGGGAINGTGKLIDSTSDFKSIQGAECVMTMEDIVDLELGRFRIGNPRWGGVGGGLQIDKYGNSNMVCIGDYYHPKVRGVGTVGICFSGSSNYGYAFVLHHHPKVIVDKVDFISGAGFTEERKKYIPPESEGPKMCFTSLCIFDFDPVEKIMRVKSVHPGHTVDEVLARTGFKPIIPANVPETEPPTEYELQVLRNKIDPDGILKKFILG